MGNFHSSKPVRACLAALTFLLAAGAAQAGPLRDRLAAQHGLSGEEDDAEPARFSLPAGAQVIRDVAYGRDNEQRFDVYLPHNAHIARNAPVIFMVHGGGWKRGDKALRSVVENKVQHWVAQGFILVSTNYRLLPKAAPVEQAEDIARAIAVAQRSAASWGGDPSKFILIGHSAGAHLVALLSSSPGEALRLGASPWLGAVLLDSAALNVVQIMEQKHYSFYDPAFGADPAYWRRASPYYQLSSAAVPMLAVCSSRRSDSCPQAHQFADKARALGVRTQVSEQDLSHREINVQLGESGRYTDTVDAFIRSLQRQRP